MSVRLLIGLVVGSMLFVVALLVLPPPVVKLDLSEGGLISIKSLSLFKSFSGGTALVDYKKGSVAGEVAIWQDFFDGPILVEQFPDTDVLLCLYDDDTSFQLLRINPNMKFQPFPNASSEVSSRVVCASPWEVHDADIRDWRTFSDCLKRTPEAVLCAKSVCFLPITFNRTVWIQGICRQVEEQERMMIKNDANHWPVLKTLRYPHRMIKE